MASLSSSRTSVRQILRSAQRGGPHVAQEVGDDDVSLEVVNAARKTPQCNIAARRLAMERGRKCARVHFGQTIS